MNNDQFAQGDIYFKRVPNTHLNFYEERLSKRAPKDTKIIAYGEKTGHAHVIEGMGKLYDWDTSKMFLRADDDLQIIHADIGGSNPNDKCHPPLALEKGLYEVVQQREFDYANEAKENRATMRARD